MGFADHYVPQADLPDFVAAIAADGSIPRCRLSRRHRLPASSRRNSPGSTSATRAAPSAEIVAALGPTAPVRLTTPPI